MTGKETVQRLLAQGCKLVFWPDKGATKGPSEKDWLEKAKAGYYTIDKYHEGDRVGVLHGVQLSPGHFIIDVDIDYGPGAAIAVAMIPNTRMLWGRPSKRISHCLYTAPELLPMKVYKDLGKNARTLLEFRADVHQSMIPPTTWEKDGVREVLSFIAQDLPTHCESAASLLH